jgi:hypothetical protein
MYDQDQEAWRATDVLTAQHSQTDLKEQKLHGWIVENVGGRDVVRFIRDGASGPEVFCDVNFASQSATSCSDPQDRSLNADELAQYHARALALANVKRRCSERYNTIALRDPENDGWLVWAMAATTNPKVIVTGGHYRFTISKDGKTIRQADALSRACMTSTMPDVKDATEDGYFVSELVALTPLEIHAFASLQYRIPIFVGTLDGKTWRIDQSEIRQIDSDAAGTDGFTARMFAGREENCQAILSKVIGGTTKYVTGPSLQVIEETERSKFHFDAPDGTRGSAVICVRLDIVPEPNDFEVVLAGYPLFISDKGANHTERMGVLEFKQGKFAFRVSQGDALTPDLQARVDARLTMFQNSVQQTK